MGEQVRCACLRQRSSGERLTETGTAAAAGEADFASGFRLAGVDCHDEIDSVELSQYLSLMQSYAKGAGERPSRLSMRRPLLGRKDGPPLGRGSRPGRCQR